MIHDGASKEMINPVWTESLPHHDPSNLNLILNWIIPKERMRRKATKNVSVASYLSVISKMFPLGTPGRTHSLHSCLQISNLFIFIQFQVTQNF